MSDIARREFEDWTITQGDMPLERSRDGEYIDAITYLAWQAWWQAWHAQDQKIGLLATELASIKCPTT